jgi:hypothetical protein
VVGKSIFNDGWITESQSSIYLTAVSLAVMQSGNRRWPTQQRDPSAIQKKIIAGGPPKLFAPTVRKVAEIVPQKFVPKYLSPHDAQRAVGVVERFPSIHHFKLAEVINDNLDFQWSSIAIIIRP